VRVAIDTNRLTDLFRGDGELAEQLATCDHVAVPLVVLGEIRAGFYGGNRQHDNELVLRMFLAKPTVSVLLPTRETAEHYGRLFVQLKKAGTPVPDNDLWIAAQVLEHDLQLISRDGRFDKIPQLTRA